MYSGEYYSLGWKRKDCAGGEHGKTRVPLPGQIGKRPAARGHSLLFAALVVLGLAVLGGVLLLYALCGLTISGGL